MSETVKKMTITLESKVREQQWSRSRLAGAEQGRIQLKGFRTLR